MTRKLSNIEINSQCSCTTSAIESKYSSVTGGN